MKLIKLSRFRELVYMEGSAPALSTLRRRIDNGEIPGGHPEHGRYYIDLDEYDRCTRLREKLAAERAELARNPLLTDLM